MPYVFNTIIIIIILVPLNNTIPLCAYPPFRFWPPGTGPHRYRFLLLKQPVNFAASLDFSSYAGPDPHRPYCNMSRFFVETSLVNPVAANYFVSELFDRDEYFGEWFK